MILGVDIARGESWSAQRVWVQNARAREDEGWVRASDWFVSGESAWAWYERH